MRNNRRHGLDTNNNRIHWLCFTPDSRYAYVSIRSENKVAVVDCATKKVINHIEVGNTPKRNLVLVLED